MYLDSTPHIGSDGQQFFRFLHASLSLQSSVDEEAHCITYSDFEQFDAAGVHEDGDTILFDDNGEDIGLSGLCDSFGSV